ncbi:type IV secretion system DNA-binding domain-containing protein [Candidatus Sumerlaeota bacterium]|nr:type IV secretion system DNA-binding domain-containing protein [Candidatus Sumerlaeota bacterium]
MEEIGQDGAKCRGKHASAPCCLSVKRYAEGMASLQNNPITFFGQTDFRGENRRFGIYQTDRRAHMYMIGKTGTGKSTLLENLIRQDMENGRGLALLDPHGDLCEKIYALVPAKRQKDVIYFNAADANAPGFNPLERVPPDKFALAASGLLEAFRAIWLDSWGPRLEHILRNAILALLETPGSTLADIPRLFNEKPFRAKTATALSNPQVKNFWLREYEGYTARLRAEAIAPIQNKAGAFLAHPVLNRILTQQHSGFHARNIMDKGQVLLINLAKGKIGYDASRLLGALLLSRLTLAGLSRADQLEVERRDFYIYLDEFPSYATLELAMMLSELRKYRVGLILAHQYLTQLDLPLRDAILGNAGTLIAFRTGVADAEILAKEFYPVFKISDLTNLPNYRIYLKLMIDGAISEPFSAATLPPLQLALPSNEIISPQEKTVGQVTLPLP